MLLSRGDPDAFFALQSWGWKSRRRLLGVQSELVSMTSAFGDHGPGARSNWKRRPPAIKHVERRAGATASRKQQRATRANETAAHIAHLVRPRPRTTSTHPIIDYRHTGGCRGI